jgi:hypothetical protein
VHHSSNNSVLYVNMLSTLPFSSSTVHFLPLLTYRVSQEREGMRSQHFHKYPHHTNLGSINRSISQASTTTALHAMSTNVQQWRSSTPPYAPLMSEARTVVSVTTPRVDWHRSQHCIQTARHQVYPEYTSIFSTPHSIAQPFKPFSHRSSNLNDDVA